MTVGAAAPAPTPSTNLIDVIVDAGRTYASYAWVLLGVSAILQAAKVASLFLSEAAFGDAGFTVGSFLATVVLVFNGGVCARLIVDARAGDPPATATALLQRTLPALPGLLALSLIVVAPLAGGRLLMDSSDEALSGVGGLLTLIGLTLYPVWLLAAPAKVAEGLSIAGALRVSHRLVQTAVLSVILLLVFQLFTLELIPSLTDSVAGRKAPLVQWWPVEGVISALISPLSALTVAAFYLALVAKEEAAAVEAAQTVPQPPTGFATLKTPSVEHVPARARGPLLPLPATGQLPSHDTIVRVGPFKRRMNAEQFATYDANVNAMQAWTLKKGDQIDPDQAAMRRMIGATGIPMVLGLVFGVFLMQWSQYDTGPRDNELLGALLMTGGITFTLVFIASELARRRWVRDREDHLARSRVVNGLVIELRTIADPVYRQVPVVRFRLGRDDIELPSRGVVPGAVVGQTIQVRYDPQDTRAVEPNITGPKTHPSEQAIPWWVTVIAAGVAVAGEIILAGA